MDDEYEEPSEECWDCGGDCQIAHCFEEFACIDPEGGCNQCLRRCETCGGKGYLPVSE